jgi:hypothetical protein
MKKKNETGRRRHYSCIGSKKHFPKSLGLLQKSLIMNLFNFSPLTLNPLPLRGNKKSLPPKGAREVIAPKSFPAPFGGRMSEGQIGGRFKCELLHKARLFHNFSFQSYVLFGSRIFLINFYFCILMFLCLIFSISCDFEKKASPPLIFAVFGNSGSVTDEGELFNSLITAVNNSKVDFSFDLGNRLPEGISSSGLEPLYDVVDKDREKFSSPVYPVAGALDIFDYESDLAYNGHYGPSWYSFIRKGITFVVLNTGDDSYRNGFGKGARIGDEQMGWLGKCLAKAGKSPVVLLMNRPIWKDASQFWRDRLLKVLKKGNITLIITSYDEGLFDWGIVDGFRAVSTGCVGTVDKTSPGLFPHALVVTMDGKKKNFNILSADGIIREGIPITAQIMEKFHEFSGALTPPVLNCSPSWGVSESMNIHLANPFDFPLTGKLSFRMYPSASWSIRPDEMEIVVNPKTKKTYYVDIQGTPPDLGPLPDYTLELDTGENGTFSQDGSLALKIPHPHTGKIIPISAITANAISYQFDGKPLRIPVSIKEPDAAGCLVIYREDTTKNRTCIFVSDLKDLRPSMNEFVWNGRNLNGGIVANGPLLFTIFVFNRKAPVTWAANGPAVLQGSFMVERDPAGLAARTHANQSLISYRIGSSLGDPKGENLESFDDLLDGMPIDGFAFDDQKRIFLSTQAGIACAVLSGSKVSLDHSFGDRGYLRFTDYRGRKIGNISYSDGNLYAGVGGGIGKGPEILIIDCAAGKIVSKIDLSGYFETDPVPPSVTADKNGIYVAHPYGDVVLRLSRNGETVWISQTKDRIGEDDTDGKSFVYNIGIDQFGFTYVPVQGVSARCGVIGPDGHWLFEIVPPELYGLRVSSVVPMIEGKESDGLYLVTRGGDVPYVFHVPFTMRTGTIVEKH